MPNKLLSLITKLTLVLILGTLFLSCKEKLSKFIFDMSKTSQQTKYFYVTHGGKPISQIEKSYTVMLGNVVDSMIVTTYYEYDSKGLLRKESRQTDFEDKPELCFYTYNSIDSLISQLTVNTDGDTTFIEKYEYYPDGRKTVFQRILMLHLDENPDITDLISKKQLDTTFYKNEFFYDKGLCTLKIQYNMHGMPVNEVQFEYQGQRLIKETHKTTSHPIKLIEKVKYWNYSKSKIKPDYFSLDSRKDTVERGINEFEDASLVSTTELFNYGNVLSKMYYEKGRVIGIIAIDKKMNHKSTNSFRYNDKGDIVETMSYSEELN